MEATQIIHWLGKDTPCCDSHALALKNLGATLLGTVSSTSCVGMSLTCTNCENEAKQKGN